MSNDDDVTIKLENVNFRYFESPQGLNDINLTCRKGDRVIILGHNGSGKSTLLSLIGGKRMASTGSSVVLGTDAFNDTTLNFRVSLIGPPWPPEAYFANTVDSVASPAPDPARKEEIARRLHLPLTANVDKMSSGEKRRVQILHGMLRRAEVLLLDECSTDIDVAERASVLQIVRDECEKYGVTCLYATHILDGVGGWATHLMTMRDGAITSYQPVSAITTSLEVFAHRFMAHREALPFPAYFENDERHKAAAAAAANGAPREPCIVCRDFTYKSIFANMSFTIYKGSRTLLVGCNGSGKSTLLNMLGGKQYFNNNDKALVVNGKPCYEDMTLNAQISYCGDWWTKPPTCEVYVHEMVPLPLSARAERIRELLAVDLNWDVRHISSGEQKRVQLFLYMHVDRPIMIHDESTADLDVDQRHELLKFLYQESLERGVTVVYTTHIFEGLAHWASDLIILDRTTRGVHRVISEAAGEKIDLGELTQILCELKAKEAF